MLSSLFFFLSAHVFLCNIKPKNKVLVTQLEGRDFLKLANKNKENWLRLMMATNVRVGTQGTPKNESLETLPRLPRPFRLPSPWLPASGSCKSAGKTLCIKQHSPTAHLSLFWSKLCLQPAGFGREGRRRDARMILLLLLLVFLKLESCEEVAAQFLAPSGCSPLIGMLLGNKRRPDSRGPQLQLRSSWKLKTSRNEWGCSRAS